MKSAAATCAVRGAAASRFRYHFLAVRIAHKKMMLYPLLECVSFLAAKTRRQCLADGLKRLLRQALFLCSYKPVISRICPTGYSHQISQSCREIPVSMPYPITASDRRNDTAPMAERTARGVCRQQAPA